MKRSEYLEYDGDAAELRAQAVHDRRQRRRCPECGGSHAFGHTPGCPEEPMRTDDDAADDQQNH